MNGMETVELDVGPVAHGGWCVARHLGQVVFVRHALPGERVRARIVERTSRFLRADAVEVLAGSPDRVAAPCEYAGPGRCGGCDWQHASPEAQRRLKSDVVREQLERLAGIRTKVEVEALPGDQDGLGWRTRVRFAVRGDGRIGFHRYRSHDVQPVERCLITHPDVEALGLEQRRWAGVDVVEGVASASTGDRVVRVDGPARRPQVPRLDAPVRVVRGKPSVGPKLPYVRESACGRTWRVSGTSFWQVHPAAAEALAAAVSEALEPRAGERAIDLFCGVGLFAGVLGTALGEDGAVLGVESDPVAVADARHNLADLPRVRIVRGRVDRVLSTGHGSAGDPEWRDGADIAVLDPPRTGAGAPVVRALAGQVRRAIAYVSCDPATLARDLRYFAAEGWRLTGLRAFDAFPMTHHVECVALLEPEPSSPT